jgi:hypothetical protein
VSSVREAALSQQAVSSGNAAGSGVDVRRVDANEKGRQHVDEKDINATLTQYENLGRLNETPDVIDARLHAAVEAAGATSGIHPVDLGFADWAAETVKRIKIAVHKQICDSAERKLKPQYEDFLDKGTSKEAIASVSSVITSVLVALNLAPLAISSVVLYLAIWITKVGLNYWCSQPIEQD